MLAGGQAASGDMLMLWAEATGRRRAAGHGPGGLRFAFYGRVSTEDWQDPVTSRAPVYHATCSLSGPLPGLRELST
jgi:site-specific DNA recombinase